jgi:hypothetical protein
MIDYVFTYLKLGLFLFLLLNMYISVKADITPFELVKIFFLGILYKPIAAASAGVFGIIFVITWPIQLVAIIIHFFKKLKYLKK